MKNIVSPYIFYIFAFLIIFYATIIKITVRRKYFSQDYMMNKNIKTLYNEKNSCNNYYGSNDGV
jgi:hypothetical protein